MKFTTLSWITATALFAVLAMPVQSTAQQQGADPPPHYVVTDLGTLGGTFSIAFGLNRAAHVAGGADLSNGNQHPFLWTKDNGMQDLGTLGGPNGNAAGPNDSDELAVLAETSTPDPLGEDFCGFRTHLVCLGAYWQNGVMTAFPTLGGDNDNGQGFGLNDRGQVIGVTETSTKGKSCVSPQVLRYEAVLWGPKQDDIQELPPLPGDIVGFALGINDKGDVVVATGRCANTPLVQPPASASPTGCQLSTAFPCGPHAVLWQNGVPTDLGSLGGKLVNVAAAINDKGQVVGSSDLPGDRTNAAFLWTKATGMQNIGTLGTDQVGFAGTTWRDQQCGTGGWPILFRLWGDWQLPCLPLAKQRDDGPQHPDPGGFAIVSGRWLRDKRCGRDRRPWVTGTGQLHAFLATPQRGQ
jgi:probable HAF family extracellular repeat protein